PRTRRALIDIGAAGPIAGFVATVPVLILGLRWSTVVPVEPQTPHWTLFDALLRWFQQGTWPPLREAFDLGYPLGMSSLQALLMGLGLGMHPRLSEPEHRIDRTRRVQVAVSLLLFLLSFSPVPLALLAR